jgi:hypothetical protein
MGLFSKSEPTNVAINGQRLQCQVCHHDTFWGRDVQLHTAVATFFDLEWTNPSARCYVCASCGYIHWFLPQ